jgi:hypothetical protein
MKGRREVIFERGIQAKKKPLPINRTWLMEAAVYELGGTTKVVSVTQIAQVSLDLEV